MRAPRYAIRLPATEPHTLGQDEAWFELDEQDHTRRVAFHDYATLYELPHLYEQLFYDRLKCQSPRVVARRFQNAVEEAGQPFSELRVLDLGAGNGIMGEELQGLGVARLVGVDILPEARAAAMRDRPGVYDAFHVADLTDPDCPVLDEIRGWRLDALTTVAALGFGDIPAAAFRTALGLIAEGGWVAFNIKETFLTSRDTTGFSSMIREMLYGHQLELHHLERYRHRISIDGRPLYYLAIVARKICDQAS